MIKIRYETKKLKKVNPLLYRTEGFSLIEVMVAMFIFLSVFFSFTFIFADSMKNIFSKGTRGNNLYKAQQDIDNSIASQTSPGNSALVINFSTPITVNGSQITTNEPFIDSRGNTENVTLTVFVPNR